MWNSSCLCYIHCSDTQIMWSYMKTVCSLWYLGSNDIKDSIKQFSTCRSECGRSLGHRAAQRHDTSPWGHFLRNRQFPWQCRPGQLTSPPAQRGDQIPINEAVVRRMWSGVWLRCEQKQENFRVRDGLIVGTVASYGLSISESGPLTTSSFSVFQGSGF